MGIAVTEAAVIPSPEEICPEMCPRILGPALMSTTPCAFVGMLLSTVVSHLVSTTQLQTDAELKRLTKHQRAKIFFPAGSFLCLVLLGRMFTSGSACPVACAARQSSPLAFIMAGKQWNLSEAEEYTETSRADGRGGLSVGLVVQ